MDICENGVKHSTWEMTAKQVDRAFFAAHSVSELLTWNDFALEDAGRLTEPMQYDAETDRYVPIEWDAAFALAGTADAGDWHHQEDRYGWNSKWQGGHYHGRGWYHPGWSWGPYIVSAPGYHSGRYYDDDCHVRKVRRYDRNGDAYTKRVRVCE